MKSSFCGRATSTIDVIPPYDGKPMRFRFYCSCGETGEERLEMEEAERDLMAHYNEDSK